MNETLTQYGQLPTHYSSTESLVEIEVKEFLEDFADAVRSGDLDKIMAFYDDDVVAFDMMPPLRLEGKGAYREEWKEYFTEYFRFPVSYAYSEQKIAAVGDGAWSFGLLHISGTGKNDVKKVDVWIRKTICVQKCDGEWKIVHEHNSVPINREDQRALLDLDPHVE